MDVRLATIVERSAPTGATGDGSDDQQGGGRRLAAFVGTLRGHCCFVRTNEIWRSRRGKEVIPPLSSYSE